MTSSRNDASHLAQGVLEEELRPGVGYDQPEPARSRAGAQIGEMVGLGVAGGAQPAQGRQTMDDALVKLANRGTISLQDADPTAEDKQRFQQAGAVRA